MPASGTDSHLPDPDLTASSGGGSAGDESDVARLARVDEIVTRELGKQTTGTRLDISGITSRHPEIAGELRAALQGAAKLDRAIQHASGIHEPLPLRIDGYKVVRELGRGGMGVVVEADDLELDRRVAIKLLPRAASEDAEYLARFQREAHAAARLEHPNVIPIYGVGHSHGQAYIAMKLVDGHSLDEILTQLAHETRAAHGELIPHSAENESSRCVALRIATERIEKQAGDWSESGTGSSSTQNADMNGAPISLGATYYRNVAKIVLSIASALGHAHARGVLHRDIKPGNILLDHRGHVWVADFGLAKLEEKDDVTRAGEFVGTLRYMAPEQFQGHAEPRSDTYALGLVLYELLTLEPAIKGRDRAGLAYSVLHQDPKRPRAVRPGIPADLEQIAMKACTKLPTERYRSAGALALDLRAYLDGRPIAARMPSALYLTRLAVTRNRPLFAAIAVAAGLLLLGGAAYITELRRAHREESRLAYRSSLAAASAALKDADIPTARTHLAACPPDQRGWEWQHLRASLDQSTKTTWECGEPIRQLDLTLHQGEQVIAVTDRGGLTLIDDNGNATEIPTPFSLGPDEHGYLTSRVTDRHAYLFSAEHGLVRVPLDPGSAEETRFLKLDGGSEVVAMTPDATRAVVYRGTRLVVVDLPAMEVEKSIPCDDFSLRQIRISDDGAMAWTASLGGKVVAWNLDSGEPSTLMEIPTHLLSVAVSRDGQTVVAGGMDGAIYLVERTAGISAPRQLLGHTSHVLALSISEDGRYLVSAGEDKTVRVWDLKRRRLIQTMVGHSRRIYSVLFDQANRRIVSGGRAGVVKEWRAGVSAGRESIEGHHADVVALGHSKDGLRFATGARDSTLRIHDVATHRLDGLLIGHPTELNGLVWHAEDREITSVDRHGVVINWDVNAAHALWQIDLNGVGVAPVYTADESTVFVATHAGVVVALDPSTGEERARTTLEGDGADSIALCPDDRTLLVGGISGTLFALDPATLELRGRSLRHHSRIAAIEFDPSRSAIVTVGWDHRLVLSADDQLEGERFLDLGGLEHSWATDALPDLDISPDGSLCAVASHSWFVRLVDLDSMSVVLDLPGHADWVKRVSFSMDGTSLVSTGASAFVRVWDTVRTADRATAVDARLALEEAGAALVASWLEHPISDPDDISRALKRLDRDGGGHADLHRSARAYLFQRRDEMLIEHWQRELCRRTGSDLHSLADGARAYLRAEQRHGTANGSTERLSAMANLLRGRRESAARLCERARGTLGDATANADPVLVALESILTDNSADALDRAEILVSRMSPASAVKTATLLLEFFRSE